MCIRNIQDEYSWVNLSLGSVFRYWEAQIQIGEAIQGWGFWTWKAENADDWSYQAGLKGGWIPQDPTDMLYPNMCGQNG